jgi:hypothetical protein
MIIQERTGTITIPSAMRTRQRRLRVSLLFAALGLALFVGSCAFTGTTSWILLLIAGVLGLTSIVCTVITLKRWPLGADERG